MTDYALYIFEKVWNVMTHLRCEVLLDVNPITVAKVNRLVVETQNTDLGQSQIPSAVVEFPKAYAPKPAEDLGGIKPGNKLKIRMLGATEWKTFRAGSVSTTGTSVMRISLKPEFD